MKKKRMADGLLEGLKQAVQIEKGKTKSRDRISHLSRPAPKLTTKEIQKLRTEVFKMSQPVFASLLNVKPATIRAWEQGQRTPDGATLRLLEILLINEDIVETLAA